jgi:hypothetical protein
MATGVTRKTEIGSVDGTPDKRLYWSIISDYDLRSGLCELIDNALGLWMLEGKSPGLKVGLRLDAARQMISVEDNAGGVSDQDLRLLVAPGGSRNSPQASIIGVFGVGSKRASVALGEQVSIRTRHKRQRSFQIDISKEWLVSGDWEIASYEIPDLQPSTTRVDITELRQPFTDDDVTELKGHLGEVYSWFIAQGCAISVNGTPIVSKTFDHWGYPAKYPPRIAKMTLAVDGVGDVEVSVTGGLIIDRDPQAENYGVYFYCNRRLIVKELRSRDVGYLVTSEAGVPHPDASLARVIVEMEGPARAMPWNSSMSAINTSHPAFQQLRPAE